MSLLFNYKANSTVHASVALNVLDEFILSTKILITKSNIALQRI